MKKPNPNLRFESKEEFRDICRSLSARLGYLNRVAIGEAHFASAVSDMVLRLGAVFEAHLKDAETNAAFGSGFEAGSIAREDRAKALFDLMYPQES